VAGGRPRVSDAEGVIRARVGPDGRTRISSGGPWEERYGYARALVAGDACFVSGTTDAGPDGRARHSGAGEQAAAIFVVIREALGAAGFAVGDVVRTRMYVVNESDIPAVAEEHGRWFREIRPAATLVLVRGLIDPTLLVEIEAEARRP